MFFFLLDIDETFVLTAHVMFIWLLVDTNEKEVEAGVGLAARVVIKAVTGVGTRAGAGVGAGVGAQCMVPVQRISDCH